MTNTTTATPSVWSLADKTREQMAHDKMASALERVRRAEHESEKALDDLEAAIREQRDVNLIEVIPHLSSGFQSMWEERRIRLMVEAEL